MPRNMRSGEVTVQHLQEHQIWLQDGGKRPLLPLQPWQLPYTSPLYFLPEQKAISPQNTSVCVKAMP